MESARTVFDLATKVMDKAEHVSIDYTGLYDLVNKMLDTGITPFPAESTGEREDTIIAKELTASAINYCYWYGRSDVRPLDNSSTTMYNIVNTHLDHYPHTLDLETAIEKIKWDLASHRFSLLEERCRHLDEVVGTGGMIMKFIDKQANDAIVDMLVTFMPGFGADLFLKRVSLFFLQLYRRLGWFEDFLTELPVPADYQVPKMLRYFGALEYSTSLASAVDNNILLPKGSNYECEIRAATILACKEIMRETKWNISDIDGWLWLRRKECNDNFHLTITTDY